VSAACELTVVKLGGSYAFSPHLRDMLSTICSARAPVVVAPGGGPFADTVREAQPRMGFGDSAAHRMALLAMAQFAESLVSLAPAKGGSRKNCRVAASVAAIRETLAENAVPVWSPWPMADGLETLPESWALTSDSLSAWLAGKLGAARLILIKHRDPPGAPVSLAEAARAEIVDPLFLDHAWASGATIWWLGPSHLNALAAWLSGTLPAGVRLELLHRESSPA
jgi:5-(aminomethyl)-3-furanmethanol phosphate kinase